MKRVKAGGMRWAAGSMRRPSPLPVYLAVWLAAMAGCAGGASQSGDKKEKEKFRIGVWDVIRLKPGDITPVSVDVFLYDPLNNLASRAWQPGHTPDIAAERVEYAPDGKQITYKLRKGMRFHNGQEVTAGDVAFSVKQDSASPMPSYFTPIAIEILDRYTVRMTVEKAIDWSKILEIRLLSAEYTGKMADVESWEYVPMGSGPYRFKKYDKERQILTLERWEGYWAGPAKYRIIEIHHFENQDAETIAFLEGKLDFISEVSGADIPLIRKSQNIHVAATGVKWLSILVFNPKRPAFRDSRVRRALSLLIDRKALVNEEDQAGQKAAATDSLFNLAPPYTPPAITDNYAGGQAMELLRQAGCAYEGRRILCGGAPLEAEIIAFTDDQSRSFTALRKVVAAWNEYGVCASIRILPFEKAQRLVLQNDYDMVFTFTGERRDTSSLPGYFECHTGYFCMEDEELRRLYKSYLSVALSGAGEGEQLAAKTALQRAMREAAWLIPLYSIDGYSAVWGKEYYSRAFQKDPALLGYQARPGLVR